MNWMLTRKNPNIARNMMKRLAAPVPKPRQPEQAGVEQACR